MKLNMIYVFMLLCALPISGAQPPAVPAQPTWHISPANIQEILSKARTENANGRLDNFLSLLPREIGQRIVQLIEQEQFTHSLSAQEREKVSEILKETDLIDASQEQKLQVLEAILGMRIHSEKEYEAQVQQINTILALKIFESIANNPITTEKLVKFIRMKAYNQPALSYLIAIALNINTAGAHALIKEIQKDPQAAKAFNYVLYKAVKKGEIATIRALFGYNAVEADGLEIGLRTPLMIAVWYPPSNYLDVITLLLDKGAKINAVEGGGKKYTVLMYAVEKNLKDVVKLLLERHADPKIKTPNGDTALKLAKDSEIRNMLKQYGAKE